MKKFRPYMTSARYLLNVLESLAKEGDEVMEKRVSIGRDMYIKAFSWALLNKIFYFLALFGAISITILPSALALGLKAELLDAAIIQSTITAVTGLSVYFYRQYKVRQMLLENILRDLCFSQKSNEEILEDIKMLIGNIDQGVTYRSPTSDNKE